jgi:pyruvate/2-oxoglutarate/acetoin dehydrogenase E1 component
MIVYEACQTAGFGAEIGMRIVEKAFDYLDAPVVRVAGKDLPIPYSPAIGTKVVPSSEDIVMAAHDLLSSSPLHLS